MDIIPTTHFMHLNFKKFYLSTNGHSTFLDLAYLMVKDFPHLFNGVSRFWISRIEGLHTEKIKLSKIAPPHLP